MLRYFSSGSSVAFSGSYLITKFLKFKKMVKIEEEEKKIYMHVCFKFLIWEKNIEMYAGPPKIAQELFFWSYGLRVC